MRYNENNLNDLLCIWQKLHIIIVHQKLKVLKYDSTKTSGKFIENAVFSYHIFSLLSNNNFCRIFFKMVFPLIF